MGGDNITRQMVLALYVLTGVMTKEQMTELIESGNNPPSKWQDIVKVIETRYRNGSN